MVRPETFLTLKIFKSTMEFIRLEGEIEVKGHIPVIIMKLDGKTIKLSGFTDILKVNKLLHLKKYEYHSKIVYQIVSSDIYTVDLIQRC